MKVRGGGSGVPRARLVAAALAATAAAAWTAGPRPAPAQEPGAMDREAVTSMVRAYHDALASGDSARAIRLLHPEVRVYEGGHAETLDEYRSGHLSADMEFSGSVEREVLSERVFGDADQAVYLSEYRMSGSFSGEELDVRGTETMVLARDGDGWRIRHIHWSSR